MNNIYLKIYSILLLLFLSSCLDGGEQKPIVRLVDMQGRPKNIKVKNIEMNSQITSSETEASNSTIVQNQNEAPNNNFNAQNPKIKIEDSPKRNDFGSFSSEALKNSLYSQSNPAKDSSLDQLKSQNELKSANIASPERFVATNQSDSPVTIPIIKSTNSPSNIKPIESSSQNIVVENLSNRPSYVLNQNQSFEPNNTGNTTPEIEFNLSKSEGSEEKKLPEKILNFSSPATNKNNDLGDNKKIIFQEDQGTESIIIKRKAKSNPVVTKIEIKQKPSIKKYYVQIGSFSNERAAEDSLSKMNRFSSGKIESVEKDEKTIYRALLGPFKDKNGASAMVKKIKNSGNEAIIVRSQ